MNRIYQRTLRVIGGTNDGGSWTLDREYLSVGDTVRLMKKIELKIADFNPSTMVGELVDCPVEYYKIRCYCFAKDDYYYFLAPAEWTNREAMLFQFAK